MESTKMYISKELEISFTKDKDGGVHFEDGTSYSKDEMHQLGLLKKKSLDLYGKWIKAIHIIKQTGAEVGIIFDNQSR